MLGSPWENPVCVCRSDFRIDITANRCCTHTDWLFDPNDISEVRPAKRVPRRKIRGVKPWYLVRGM